MGHNASIAYSYDIEYRKGSEHGNGDCLCRLPREGATEPGPDMLEEGEFEIHAVYTYELSIDSKDIANQSRRDTTFCRVYDLVMSGWPTYVRDHDLKPYFVRRTELSAEAGCLLWGNRVIIPPPHTERDCLIICMTHTQGCVE